MNEKVVIMYYSRKALAELWTGRLLSIVYTMRCMIPNNSAKLMSTFHVFLEVSNFITTKEAILRGYLNRQCPIWRKMFKGPFPACINF